MNSTRIKTAAYAGTVNNKQNSLLLKLTLIMAGGMFIDGFVLGYIGALMPFITADLNLNPTWQGLIGSATLFGMFFGAPLGGWLADKFGRKPMFLIDLLIFLSCSIAQFFVTDAYTLFIVRILMGIAIGIEYAVSWPLLAEFAPARLRGKLLGLTQVAWYLGYVVSYALGYLLSLHKLADWNVVLALGAIPTLIVLMFRWGAPESPRWLMIKGRKAEAMAIAEKYLSKEDQEDILKQKCEPAKNSAGFLDLFKSRNIKGTIFFTTFFFAGAAPYYAIGFFIPTVLQKIGLKDGFMGGLFLNMMAVVGTIATIMIVSKVKRRTLAVYPFLFSTIALGMIAFVSDPSDTLILMCFLAFAWFNSMIGAMTPVFPGESYAPEISGIGTGFSAAVSRLGAGAGVFLVPIIIDQYGVQLVMWIAAGISLFATIICMKFTPNSDGKKLSEIFHH